MHECWLKLLGSSYVQDVICFNQTWGQFISGIGITYLKKIGINEFGIEVCYQNKFNPQINLPLNFFNSDIFSETILLGI